MKVLAGELKDYAAWWKVTPFKNKRRSASTLTEHLRQLERFIAAHPTEDDYTLAIASEWVSQEQDRSDHAGRWAARALKSFDGWRVEAYRPNYKPVLDRLPVPAEPAAQRNTAVQPEQVVKMLASCTGIGCVDLRDAALIHCLRSTGMRIGEVARMNMADIDFETGIVTVPKTKNGEVRKTRLDSDALRALRGYRRTLRDQSIPFVWQANAKTCRLAPHSIQKRITYRAELAGLTGVTAHAFRRGFTMVAYRKGIPTEYVMKMCGWNKLDMPRRYLASVLEDESLDFHAKAFG